jgi:phosphonate C-P lyase system protein PhnH
MHTDVDLYRSNLVDCHESQELFRLLLKALSRPGTVLRTPEWVSQRTLPALTPIISLVSHDVPFALIGSVTDGLDEALARATTGRLAPVTEAVFLAVIGGGSEDLAEVRVGTPERPDNGCQIGVQVDGRFLPTPDPTEATTNAAVASLTFRGPGVPGSSTIGFAATFDEVERLGSILGSRTPILPCGFDLWLFDARDQLVGVPRTSRIDFSVHVAEEGVS